MRHWPFSIIKNSPLAPPQFAWELYRFPQTRVISPAAADACALIARDTRPVESSDLDMIMSADAPGSLVYLRPPAAMDFALLEPIGVAFHDEQYFLFVVTFQ